MRQSCKVVCIRTGDKYGSEYTTNLYRMLNRHTTYPFDFEITMRTRYPGWWGKIELFPPSERIVYLDLDVVITGNVDFLFEYQGPFCSWKDPLQDGMNSSVMNIAAGFGSTTRAEFDKRPFRFMQEFRGDQDFLDQYTIPDYWDQGLVQSYKVDGLEDSFKNARIVVFHGQPKPHECGGWVKEYWC